MPRSGLHASIEQLDETKFRLVDQRADHRASHTTAPDLRIDHEGDRPGRVLDRLGDDRSLRTFSGVHRAAVERAAVHVTHRTAIGVREVAPFDVVRANGLEEYWIYTPDMTNHALASHRAQGLEGTKQFLRECREDHRKIAWMRALHGEQNLIAIAERDYVIQYGKITSTWPGNPSRGYDIPAGDYQCDFALI